MKKTVNIDFCDFYPGFPKTDNFYYHLLCERFNVRICDQPDFLFFGPYGNEHRLHSGVRILLSIEPALPDYRYCDYSVTCRKLDDPRHLYLPAYVSWCARADEAIKQQDDPERLLAGKTKFCSFIVSNYHPRRNRHRVDFFHKLSKHKRVDSGGKVLNNIGGPVPGWSRGKIEFLRPYKFNIAFENRALPGYTTEKIFEPMLARCLPIYWGDPLINEQFNPCSFLNRADFTTDEALIEKIIELDRDDAKYLEYLRQPYFHKDQPNQYFGHGRLLDFFERVFTTSIRRVALRHSGFGLGRWLWVKRHHPQPARWMSAGAG
ncbi:MAG: glycosyltransferase family 10 [Verrucomicrobiota bacterium]